MTSHCDGTAITTSPSAELRHVRLTGMGSQMYNLLIGFTGDDVVSEDRVGEHTEDTIVSYIKPDNQFDPTRVANLPTLIMPETRESESGQVARVGHLDGITRRAGRQPAVSFRFIPDPAFPAIPVEHVVQSAEHLGISSKWEFTRTHWAVKDVDLHRMVRTVIVDVIPSPRVFDLPVGSAREDDLVAVMMPFAPEFDSVYAALAAAAASAGLRCQRADDIWENDAIMDDVVGLIWRSRVVVADYSGRNANVFYETGIAHTIGRDVIQIGQQISDIPFDLQGLRASIYSPTGSGLSELQAKVATRLRGLAARTT